MLQFPGANSMSTLLDDWAIFFAWNSRWMICSSFDRKTSQSQAVQGRIEITTANAGSCEGRCAENKHKVVHRFPKLLVTSSISFSLNDSYTLMMGWFGDIGNRRSAVVRAGPRISTMIVSKPRSYSILESARRAFDQLLVDTWSSTSTKTRSVLIKASPPG